MCESNNRSQHVDVGVVRGSETNCVGTVLAEYSSARIECFREHENQTPHLPLGTQATPFGDAVTRTTTAIPAKDMHRTKAIPRDLVQI